MITHIDLTVEEARLRRLFEEWTNAILEKDVEKLMAFYAPDVVAFDAVGPLQFVGRDAYRKAWETGCDCMPESIAFETRDMRLDVGEETAFCYRIVRMGGTSKNGQSCDCWMRWTNGLRKIDGCWQIVHEHVSVPFDPESNQALIHLVPEQ